MISCGTLRRLNFFLSTQKYWLLVICFFPRVSSFTSLPVLKYAHNNLFALSHRQLLLSSNDTREFVLKWKKVFRNKRSSVRTVGHTFTSLWGLYKVTVLTNGNTAKVSGSKQWASITDTYNYPTLGQFLSHNPTIIRVTEIQVAVAMTVRWTKAVSDLSNPWRSEILDRFWSRGTSGFRRQCFRIANSAFCLNAIAPFLA